MCSSPTSFPGLLPEVDFSLKILLAEKYEIVMSAVIP
jgi:hypothetical protein